MKTLEEIKDILRDHKEELHMGSVGKETPEYVPSIRGA